MIHVKELSSEFPLEAAAHYVRHHLSPKGSGEETKERVKTQRTRTNVRQNFLFSPPAGRFWVEQVPHVLRDGFSSRYHIRGQTGTKKERAQLFLPG